MFLVRSYAKKNNWFLKKMIAIKGAITWLFPGHFNSTGLSNKFSVTLDIIVSDSVRTTARGKSPGCFIAHQSTRIRHYPIRTPKNKSRSKKLEHNKTRSAFFLSCQHNYMLYILTYNMRKLTGETYRIRSRRGNAKKDTFKSNIRQFCKKVYKPCRS